jgi:hypothetical protein
VGEAALGFWGPRGRRCGGGAMGLGFSVVAAGMDGIWRQGHMELRLLSPPSPSL